MYKFNPVQIANIPELHNKEFRVDSPKLRGKYKYIRTVRDSDGTFYLFKQNSAYGVMHLPANAELTLLEGENYD
jgi:hypothetical protein